MKSMNSRRLREHHDALAVDGVPKFLSTSGEPSEGQSFLGQEFID